MIQNVRTEYRDDQGLLHCESGPALIMVNGDNYWLIHGKYHRTDGPAIELTNGYRAWYMRDRLHREDGPAIVCGSLITSTWALEGVLYTQEEHARMVKLKAFW